MTALLGREPERVGGVDVWTVIAVSLPGRLVLAATPIGDPEDASPRLARLIESADVVAAEDTRRLRRLASALGVVPRGRVVSHHEHNEAGRVAELVDVVRDGGTVLVVTDAGMPGVSDPGLRAVRAVVDAGLPVTAVPGPSAALTALAVSGLPSDRFCFEGFLPRTPGKRSSAVAGLASEPRTLVFFESPRRVAASLAALADRLRGGPAGGGVPGADEDVRGGPARLAGRAGGVGGVGGGAGRGDDRGGRPAAAVGAVRPDAAGGRGAHPGGGGRAPEDRSVRGGNRFRSPEANPVRRSNAPLPTVIMHGVYGETRTSAVIMHVRVRSGAP